MSAVKRPCAPIQLPLAWSSAARSGAAWKSASADCLSGSISFRSDDINRFATHPPPEPVAGMFEDCRPGSIRAGPGRVDLFVCAYIARLRVKGHKRKEATRAARGEMMTWSGRVGPAAARARESGTGGSHGASIGGKLTPTEVRPASRPAASGLGGLGLERGLGDFDQFHE